MTVVPSSISATTGTVPVSDKDDLSRLKLLRDSYDSRLVPGRDWTRGY